MPNESASKNTETAQKPAENPSSARVAVQETDDFGLPIRRFPTPNNDPTDADQVATQPEAKKGAQHEAQGKSEQERDRKTDLKKASDECNGSDMDSVDAKDDFQDAHSEPASEPEPEPGPSISSLQDPIKDSATPRPVEKSNAQEKDGPGKEAVEQQQGSVTADSKQLEPRPEMTKKVADDVRNDPSELEKTPRPPQSPTMGRGSVISQHSRDTSNASAANDLGISEFSHQQVTSQAVPEEIGSDGGWQEMPAFAPYDIYDDDNRRIAQEYHEEDEDDQYASLGGAGKGYTRVVMDEDAESATSMDDNTNYLFKQAAGTSVEDEDARDAMSQMQATKDLLTEGQRIAYVGIVRLEIAKLVKEGSSLDGSRSSKKLVANAAESLQMWGQKMMLRLYGHMDIYDAEQVMIEQLAQHGVQPRDLTPALMANARVHNPMAAEKTDSDESKSQSTPPPPDFDDEEPAEPPPPYSENPDEEVPEVQTPSQLPTTDKIDIDLRWTVLCDLFLLLVADSTYDARSRVLLEKVGASLDIPWPDICKFEKRVTDALEMQQAAEKENWNEDQHMEQRRKAAQTRRYVMMGLATVGGGLVIGLSAGLLAPVIGAGLAAGFTTIGVTGTSSFLAGAGGAAIITSGAAASGGFIGVRAANRRTGAVRTFEYRPLHNNKRVNLIVTVSGWLTGKVDDVRLPFSTVDPVMGDIYSVLWEPEMLRSTGDTINILATEALTQGLQQILGSTILISLMAALQLPIVLTKLAYLIDNPWAVSLARAIGAGQILADSLIERNLGTRPITLVGYSLGSRVIFSCLQELAKKGAYGLVQNVYIFGSPIVVKKDEYLRARTVVSGRFVNGYNRNDWILGYLFRLTNGGIRRVAGLAAIEDCPWIENVDVSDLVGGHMEYRKAMPSLLLRCGWLVESEEFSEIEDPDPDDHQGRQRELINEIEEARKELEKEGKSKRGSKFGLFGRRKKMQKEEWEVYEDTKGKEGDRAEDGGRSSSASNHGVLFDVDAIRAELAKEAAGEENLEKLQIREIQSTLPPMKLDLSPAPSSSPALSTPPTAMPGASSVNAARSAESMPSTRALSDGGYSAAGREPSPYAAVGGSHSAGFGGGAEEGIHMSFDTDFGNYDRSPPPPPMKDDWSSAAAATGRPEMRTSQTVPNMTLSDPWGDVDEDDEEFGKEKEITMTFA